MSLKRAFIWLTVAVTLLAAFLIYSSRTRTHLDVTPDARQEIDKAKQR